jgi:hypothetical protein
LRTHFTSTITISARELSALRRIVDGEAIFGDLAMRDNVIEDVIKNAERQPETMDAGGGQETTNPSPPLRGLGEG